MIRRSVVYAPEAREDLLALYDRIAQAASAQVALAYVERLAGWLAAFATASERGTRRDDVREGLRIIGFERRVTVAFTVSDAQVVILRLFYGGQDWGEVLSEA